MNVIRPLYVTVATLGCLVGIALLFRVSAQQPKVDADDDVVGEVSIYASAALVPQATAKGLPDCFDILCKLELLRAYRQAEVNNSLSFDLYGRLNSTKPKLFHAHAMRIPAPQSKWLWLIWSPSGFWHKAFKQWALRVPGISVVQVAEVDKLARNQCTNLANRTLVPSDRLDGGSLRCGDAGAYSRQLVWGGAYIKPWSRDDGGLSGSLRGYTPPPGGTDPAAYDTPDAAIYKMCPQVPIETPCPTAK
jgi:hypothetical protein